MACETVPVEGPLYHFHLVIAQWFAGKWHRCISRKWPYKLPLQPLHMQSTEYSIKGQCEPQAIQHGGNTP